jgi:hypothetical protein
MTLSKKIHEIVEEHSGGLKFTELMSKVVDWWIFEKGDPNLDLVQKVEKDVRKSKKLKILIYTAHRWNREKMFIYTP